MNCPGVLVSAIYNNDVRRRFEGTMLNLRSPPPPPPNYYLDYNLLGLFANEDLLVLCFVAIETQLCYLMMLLDWVHLWPHPFLVVVETVFFLFYGPSAISIFVYGMLATPPNLPVNV